MRVMVFGVFDGIHAGHRAFLRQARKFGRELIVVVARDSAVLKLKHKLPLNRERRRLQIVRKIKGVSRAMFGDRKQGSYMVIKKYRPHLICLGYDQKMLGRDLRSKMRCGLIPSIPLRYLNPYQPVKLHSSLLRQLAV